jgi:DNA-binding MurR/RpiR family transcriptional regulator
MIQFWITEIRSGRQDLHDKICSGRSPLDNLDSKIVAILDKTPFESSRSISARLNVMQSTVLRYLDKSLGFKSFHLRWVPNQLTDDLRQKRKENASAILPFSSAAKCAGWHHRVTGD